MVALVVTVIVLIILATVSINAVMGDDGIIQKAEQAAEHHANGVKSEQEALDDLLLEYEIEIGEKSPNGKPTPITVKSTNHTGTATEDTLGNTVYIPGGFKIASDSGKTVKEGIVIEDDDGNQFVWIPVSNINHDGSNKIKVDENTEVEITLGRYVFNSTTGEVLTTEGMYQYASDYASTIAFVDLIQELTIFRESNPAEDTTGTNATAKDLAGFINSANKNKGYYLARYEASYASGSTFGVGNDKDYYKPASKVSTNATTSRWTPSLEEGSSTEGRLWNYITQGNASMASRQMYYGNSYVESDLVNSYAWDTAIVYIQEMGNGNYANQGRGSNTSLLNTGSTGDQKCKIFDMAANLSEWSTEFAEYISADGRYKPCMMRGGSVFKAGVTQNRNGVASNDSGQNCCFRTMLYVK